MIRTPGILLLPAFALTLPRGWTADRVPSFDEVRQASAVPADGRPDGKRSS